jgi:RND family efflux transporter MFP subunit
MNNRWIALALAATAVFTACRGKKPSLEPNAAGAQPVAVTTASVRTRDVPMTIDETGTFVADELSDVAPAVAGRIVATPVNVGQMVQQGQVIARLDSRDAELKLQQMQGAIDESKAALRQSQSRIGIQPGQQFDPAKLPEVMSANALYQSSLAQAKQAQADEQRYANLAASGDVSKSNFERARTQMETAQAQANSARQQYEASLNAARQSYQVVNSAAAGLNSMQAQLAMAQKGVGDTQIRAPFTGYVSARPVAVGEYVSLTTKVATVVKTQTLKLQLQVPEQRAAQVKLGMTVMARVSAYPDREFEGKVTAINPAVDPNSRAFILEARFQNPGMLLRPGMFATGRVLLPGGEPAIFAPSKAVLSETGTNSSQVYVVENGRARLRVVQIQGRTGDEARVLTGLTGNERLAIDHLGELFDGAPVRVARQIT